MGNAAGCAGEIFVQLRICNVERAQIIVGEVQKVQTVVAADRHISKTEARRVEASQLIAGEIQVVQKGIVRDVYILQVVVVEIQVFQKGVGRNVY